MHLSGLNIENLLCKYNCCSKIMLTISAITWHHYTMEIHFTHNKLDCWHMILLHVYYTSSAQSQCLTLWRTPILFSMYLRLWTLEVWGGSYRCWLMEDDRLHYPHSEYRRLDTTPVKKTKINFHETWWYVFHSMIHLSTSYDSYVKRKDYYM